MLLCFKKSIFCIQCISINLRLLYKAKLNDFISSSLVSRVNICLAAPRSFWDPARESLYEANIFRSCSAHLYVTNASELVVFES